MINDLVPKRMFLTKGVGRHKFKLKSFEDALRAAGVAQQNLVQVSSILPPHCKIISRNEGVKHLKPGAICFCVLARCDTDEHGRLAASSVGVAVPKDKEKWGYLSEVHSHGMNKREAEDMSEDLAAGMLGTTLGIDLDWIRTWRGPKKSRPISRAVSLSRRLISLRRLEAKKVSGQQRLHSLCFYSIKVTVLA
ncbi:MAG: pyruvoyl-dependent arginine decarboxylase [Planctomycetota bacterium]